MNSKLEKDLTLYKEPSQVYKNKAAALEKSNREQYFITSGEA